MSSSTTTNIIPRDYVYKCNTRIYWNYQENTYFEVFSNKKHVCPNRYSSSNNNNKKSVTQTATATTNKPTYYKKSYFATQQPKPKMSNSLELLTGPIQDIQRKYEVLSDIIINEYNGRVHGSQRDRDPRTGLIDLIVYFEVPEGKREEVKQRVYT